MLSNYGLSPAQAVKLFFHQIAKTGAVPLSFDYDKKIPNYEKSAVTMRAIAVARNGKLAQIDDFNHFPTEIAQ
ncbi:hypothetical protein OA57_04455 [Chelonobacter oris]|uniref:Uncharacterized protein n=1 Tax=Chelonobacter oris TaxID=505317 RepID=A0A0A3ASA9_9PAST|nr:type II toxin-antitoxin system RelB/DinJ family antitoxin [Chelonobacter oris]KGQ70637.1 hypothetical protein OA57_04455 [Chelonobacter oris]